MSQSRIALLGLGLMGTGMARRLLGAGFPLTVWNRNPAKAAPFAAEGAHLAATPREAAARADLVISMVADDVASRGVWLGETGALAGTVRGTVLIESSTLTVAWILELARAATAAGGDFIDAPVTGSRNQSAAGELNFLVGGPAATLEKARPALRAMSRSITHLGPVGSGALIKLINNFVCGVQVAALAEALALIEKSSLNRAQALAVLTDGAPGSPLVKTLAARMAGPDYTPNFLLRLMAKDLGYATQEGSARALPLQTAAAALGLFQQAIAAGHGDQDMSAVIEPLRKK
jgi:3-hydroxyisobutyrate dehydrogenase